MIPIILGSLVSFCEGTRIYLVCAYGHHIDNAAYGLLSLSSDTLIKLVPDEVEDLR